MDSGVAFTVDSGFDSGVERGADSGVDSCVDSTILVGFWENSGIDSGVHPAPKFK